MAQIPNIADLTINPVEVQDITQVIAQKLWQKTSPVRYKGFKRVYSVEQLTKYFLHRLIHWYRRCEAVCL